MIVSRGYKKALCSYNN